MFQKQFPLSTMTERPSGKRNKDVIGFWESGPGGGESFGKLGRQNCITVE